MNKMDEYLYNLDKIYNEFGEPQRDRIVIPPPIVERAGLRKTALKNFNEISAALVRSPDHLKNYIFAELSTTGTSDGADEFLILNGRFWPKQIQSLLVKYIHEFVTCNVCKSADTNIEKINRLTFIACNKCHSKRSVMAVQCGFKATTRLDRRAARS